jgi:hypothetical protein
MLKNYVIAFHWLKLGDKLRLNGERMSRHRHLLFLMTSDEASSAHQDGLRKSRRERRPNLAYHGSEWT